MEEGERFWSLGRRLAPFDPYDDDDTNDAGWSPERYVPPFAVESMAGLPRYGRPRDIDDDGYVEGLVVASIGLLIVLGVWCLSLLFFKYYCFTTTWLAGRLARPPVPPERYRRSSSSRSQRRRGSSGERALLTNGEDGVGGEDSTLQKANSEDELSINSDIFWSDALAGEEMTMAVIAREQKRDKALKQAQRQQSQLYSTTTNGQLTLVTMLDPEAKERQEAPQFRVYIPPSLRMKLLRTYHDCLVYPDDVANAQTMIYGFFTYPNVRRDVRRYVAKYRETMERGNNAALVKYGEWDAAAADEEDDLDENVPITLDVIAREQEGDVRLKRMREKSPDVFSTANNGNIRLITARGGDGKYRIVIPRTLQPKVLRTYHECLVNPTPENNFRKVLYVHFSWNGIHKDVKEYVANGGLTEEMRSRKGGHDRGRAENGDNRSPGNESVGEDFHSHYGGDDVYPDNGPEIFGSVGDGEGGSDADDCRPIGLDEIAKEQKRDKELVQLKKDEPFVFSTVRYGNTLLTTAQNFRDNRYRIVIPKRLQGRMLKTYRECLLNPTPDRNFDTLLYNHFTWNGIHDDVEYFVSHNGRLREDDEKEGCAGEKSDLASKERRRGILKGFTHERQDEAYLEWLDENDKFERKVRRLQVGFLLCGFFMILSSILFFEHGVKGVFSSLDAAQTGLRHTQDVIDSSLLFIDEYLEAQTDIQDTAKTIGTYNTTQWCKPGESMEGIRTQVRNATYEIGVQLRDAAVRVEVEVKGIQRDLESMSQGVKNLDATFESLKGYMDFAKVVAVFIVIVVLSLMAICILDWTGGRHYLPRCVRKTTFPLIITLVLLLWIFSAAVLAGATAGADFCSAPDEAAVHIISKFQDQMSPLVFTLAMYYVTGCPADLRPEKLKTLTSTVTSIGGLVHSQRNFTQQPGLEGLCEGESSPTNLASLLALTDTMIHGIYEALVGVRDLLSCRNFNPIYTAFVYDAVCSSSVPGLSWLFFTSLAMGIFGMTMVMLRAAIQHD